jgi:hypothetical protein
MDKQLLKAYIRTIVEEEVKRVLPELLSEAVREVKTISENTNRPILAKPAAPKPAIDRGRLAELLGITREGDTFIATSENVGPNSLSAPTENLTDGQKEVVDAMNRDYSHLMKAMKIT